MDTQPAQPTGDAVRDAAAAAVAPDAFTADLLAKHAAGEKLTPSGYGKIGSWVSRLKRFAGGKDSAENGSSQRTAETGDASDLDAVEDGQAPAGALADPPIDAGLVQRTTAAVLSRVESIAKSYVGKAAANATRNLPSDVAAKTVARFDRAASIPRDDKNLMIELSPDVAASLGLNPKHYPVAVFVGCLGLWGTDLWLAVQELKAMQTKRVTPPAMSPEAETVSAVPIKVARLTSAPLM